MVTQKRKPAEKVRDADASKRKLIAGVGEILREKGFRELSVSELGRVVGKHPAIIYKHFEGLNGLIKAYTAKQDYWGPFFERFQLSESSPDEEVRQLFTELMLENFRHFYENREMQEMILWQISEPNALLRKISEEREVQGNKLLKLTDRHFEGSGIDFRAVIALILGGCYNLVLHARNNKSSVCGVDINNDRAWRSVHRTITQVINWAWEAAVINKENDKQSPIIMNYEFENLEIMAEQFAAARTGKGERSVADEGLKAEAKKLERVIMRHVLNLSNEVQIRTYLQINVHTLVSICDMLYDPEKVHNPDAQVILDLMEAVRNHVNDFIPGNLKIPCMFRDRENVVLQQQWQEMREKMIALGITPELIDLAGSPFERFGREGNKLQWADFKYLHKYAKRLRLMLEEPDMDQSGLLHCLIGLGFNYAKFTAYYSRMIMAGIAGHSGEEIKMILARHMATIRQVIVYTPMRYDRYKQPIVDELIKWIEAELALQNKLSS